MLQQRQNGDPAGKTGEEIVEPGQSRIWLRLPRQSLQHLRQQFGHQFLRPLRAQRARPTGLPGPHRRPHRLGVTVPQGLQRRTGLRRQIIGAAEIQFPRLLRRRHAEQRVIAGLHRRPMRVQHGGEAVRAGIPHEGDEVRQPRRAIRQGMGLPVGHHLQPVLHLAQERIGRFQRLGRRRWQVPGFHQQPHPIQRARHPQPRIMPAPDQLQRLGQKLNFPNAALAEFDIVAEQPDRAVGFVQINPPLHRGNIGNGGKIPPTAPDKRADFPQEMLPQRQIAGHRAGFQHRRPFPVLPHAFVVDDGRRHRDTGRGRRRVRPQPQIGAEDIAVRIAGFH